MLTARLSAHTYVEISSTTNNSFTQFHSSVEVMSRRREK